MSDREYSDPEHSDPGHSDPGHSDPGHSDPGERSILPRDVDAERAERRKAHETRLRILRGKADLAHSEVEVINALHLDPDQLEEMLANATPTEAERIRIAERRLTLRVAEARAVAEAAEAEYEQAALADFDEDIL